MAGSSRGIPVVVVADRGGLDGDRDVLDELNERIGYSRRQYAGLPRGDAWRHAALVWGVRDSVREARDAFLALGVDFTELGVRSVRKPFDRTTSVSAPALWSGFPRAWSGLPYAMPRIELRGPPARGGTALIRSSSRPASGWFPSGRRRTLWRRFAISSKCCCPDLARNWGAQSLPPIAVRDVGIAKDGSGDAWGLRQGDLYRLRPSMAGVRSFAASQRAGPALRLRVLRDRVGAAASRRMGRRRRPPYACICARESSHLPLTLSWHPAGSLRGRALRSRKRFV